MLRLTLDVLGLSLGVLDSVWAYCGPVWACWDADHSGRAEAQSWRAGGEFLGVLGASLGVLGISLGVLGVGLGMLILIWTCWCSA